MDAERLAYAKQYAHIDYDDDDDLIAGLLAAADGYLGNAGIERDVDPDMYDLIAADLVLRVYDGRESDAAHAASAPAARAMITQLKLMAAYGGGA